MGLRTNTAVWLPNQNRWQIKAQQDIKRIQAAGVMDISEVERICRALQDVVQELRILIDQ